LAVVFLFEQTTIFEDHKTNTETKGDQMRKLIAAVTFLALCSALTVGEDKRVVRPPGVEPSASWSHGILIRDTLYISGMGGEDAAGNIPGDFEAEVKQALENIGAVLKAAGMSPADVVSMQVYLTDVATFERMNAVYKSYFKDPRPTRTTVVVAKLIGQGHIEITATARK
jgi:2-iminobutanoate/2-iminopropanoate deaminase